MVFWIAFTAFWRMNENLVNQYFHVMIKQFMSTKYHDLMFYDNLLTLSHMGILVNSL